MVGETPNLDRQATVSVFADRGSLIWPIFVDDIVVLLIMYLKGLSPHRNVHDGWLVNQGPKRRLLVFEDGSNAIRSIWAIGWDCWEIWSKMTRKFRPVWQLWSLSNVMILHTGSKRTGWKEDILQSAIPGERYWNRTGLKKTLSAWVRSSISKACQRRTRTPYS
jgi:hypothetical protein